MAVNPGNVAPSSNLFPSGCYTNAIQEQIAASHEFDGVRKEKERLTAASLNKNSHIQALGQMNRQNLRDFL